MAQLVFTSASVVINSVDLSDHVKSVTIDLGAKMVDDNAMGDTFESFAAGLQTAKIDVEFVQDYANAKVDLTLFSLIGAAAFPVVVRPVLGTAKGPNNPDYTMQAVLSSYAPIAGKHGDLLSSKASFAQASALTRVTA